MKVFGSRLALHMAILAMAFSAAAHAQDKDAVSRQDLQGGAPADNRSKKKNSARGSHPQKIPAAEILKKRSFSRGQGRCGSKH
jgi:hypothetical protein